MKYLISNIMIILALNGPILIIPGANFLLIVRHATDNSRNMSLYCALGVTTAIMLHVVLSYYFVGYVLLNYKFAFEIIKYTGSLYLLYLATCMWYPKKTISGSKSVETSNKNAILSAFVEGFLIDLLNPFVIFFYVSLWATLVNRLSKSYEVFVYFNTILVITLSWFIVVGVFFSTPKIRQFLIHKTLMLNRFAGCAFIWFSYKLASSHIG